MLLIYTLENLKVSDVFRGYRYAIPGCNGLNMPFLMVILDMLTSRDSFFKLDPTSATDFAVKLS